MELAGGAVLRALGAVCGSNRTVVYIEREIVSSTVVGDNDMVPFSGVPGMAVSEVGKAIGDDKDFVIGASKACFCGEEDGPITLGGIVMAGHEHMLGIGSWKRVNVEPKTEGFGVIEGDSYTTADSEELVGVAGAGICGIAQYSGVKHDSVDVGKGIAVS